jgi:hypothetical protein
VATENAALSSREGIHKNPHLPMPLTALGLVRFRGSLEEKKAKFLAKSRIHFHFLPLFWIVGVG